MNDFLKSDFIVIDQSNGVDSLNKWFRHCQEFCKPYVFIDKRDKKNWKIQWDYIAFPMEYDEVLKGNALLISEKIRDISNQYGNEVTFSEFWATFDSVSETNAYSIAQKLADIIKSVIKLKGVINDIDNVLIFLGKTGSGKTKAIITAVNEFSKSRPTNIAYVSQTTNEYSLLHPVKFYQSLSELKERWLKDRSLLNAESIILIDDIRTHRDLETLNGFAMYGFRCYGTMIDSKELIDHIKSNYPNMKFNLIS